MGGARGWVAGRAGSWGVLPTWVWVGRLPAPLAPGHPTSICNIGVNQQMISTQYFLKIHTILVFKFTLSMVPYRGYIFLDLPLNLVETLKQKPKKTAQLCMKGSFFFGPGGGGGDVLI